MRISCCFLYFISKYGYPPGIGDMCTCIGEISKLGFDYLELEGIDHAHMSQVYANRQELKRICDDTGMKVVNFGAMLPDIVSLEKARQTRGLDTFRQAIELANYFGAGMIQADSFTPPLTFVGGEPYRKSVVYGQTYQIAVDPAFNWQTQWQVIVDQIGQCNRMARDAGLKLVMEPRVGENISNTDAMLRLLDAVDDENFGVVFDAGHQNAQKEILPLSIEKLGRHIFYVHVADNDSRTNEHLALGEGTIDWTGVFTALKKHAFDGYVAVDVGNVPHVDEAYKSSKLFLEELGQRIGI